MPFAVQFSPRQEINFPPLYCDKRAAHFHFDKMHCFAESVTLSAGLKCFSSYDIS